MASLVASRSVDNEPDWYWPTWAAAADLPRFHVLDTESSHGRYAQGTKTLTLKDLVKFHGHACDGLFRGALALAEAFRVLFPSGIVDRTDLRGLSRNSPCLGDVLSYLTGARIRFGTQDVFAEEGVQFIVQRVSSGRTVRVRERPGIYPEALAAWEKSLLSDPGAVTADAVGRLREAQWAWVRDVLLVHPADELYSVEEIAGFEWQAPPYERIGTRTDVLFKDAPR
jgi:formylmethanofuran dehydrogenase subunit E